MTVVNIPPATLVQPWAPTTVYPAGGLVLQSGTLYSAKVNFTSGAVFNPNNWNTVVEGVQAFAPNTVYEAGQPIIQAGQIYTANVNFTSSASFGASDWTLIGGGYAPAVLAVATKTAAYTIVAADRVLLLDATTGGSYAQNLPTAVGWTTRLELAAIATNANTVTLTAAAGQLIIPPGGAGANTLVLGTQASGAAYGSVTLVSDGANWRVI